MKKYLPAMDLSNRRERAGLLQGLRALLATFNNGGMRDECVVFDAMTNGTCSDARVGDFISTLSIAAIVANAEVSAEEMALATGTLISESEKNTLYELVDDHLRTCKHCIATVVHELEDMTRSDKRIMANSYLKQLV